MEMLKPELQKVSSLHTPFKALSTYATILEALGWLCVFFGCLMLFDFGGFGMTGTGIILMICGFEAGVIVGQLIKCFLSVEKNTRETNELLRHKSVN